MEKDQPLDTKGKRSFLRKIKIATAIALIVVTINILEELEILKFGPSWLLSFESAWLNFLTLIIFYAHGVVFLTWFISDGPLSISDYFWYVFAKFIMLIFYFLYYYLIVMIISAFFRSLKKSKNKIVNYHDKARGIKK